MIKWIEVANEAEIPPEGLEVFAGDEPVLLILNGETVHVLSANCTHQEMPLQGGCLEEGAWVCPHHGAHFRLTDGEASMPAVEPVVVYEVKVEDGRVFVKEPA